MPLYNEEDSIEPLYETIVQVLRQLEHSFEIIFVGDRSVDSTFVRAKQLVQQDPRLRVVKFRKNYGQTPAIAAGIDNARGRLLITMDGDLQNDLADIPRLIVKINGGNDIVVGWRYQRQDKLITRRIPSQIANWLLVVLGVQIFALGLIGELIIFTHAKDMKEYTIEEIIN